MRKPDEFRKAAAEMDAEGDRAPQSDHKQRYHDLADAFRDMADRLETDLPEAGETSPEPAETPAADH